MDIEKTVMKKFLGIFEEENFEVCFWDGEVVQLGKETPQFKVYIKKPLKKKDLLDSTSLAFGEAYINGDVEFDGDLFTVLDIILRHINQFSTRFDNLSHIFHKAGNKHKQKDEVSSHYDIGNEFYSLWLDDTMSYSCGYFKNENDSLYDAQMNKINHILKKLALKENETLLDIGCGWGGLLIQAAKVYKVKGVGITLSKEQYNKFKERIAEEGLTEYLDVRLMDYRDLKKSGLMFDKIVSVGMLEHVGRENYDLFFENVNSVLKEKGLFLLHYISGMIESEGDAFIKKYIFPGGVIPTLREIIFLSAEYNYHTLDVESLRMHYTKTLLHWYKNYIENLDKINKMFDENFIRMWSLYLCSCAAAFNNGVVDLHQILFSKGVNNNLSLTREYMYDK